MLNTIGSYIFAAFIISITEAFIIEKILYIKFRVNIKNIFLIMLMALITMTQYEFNNSMVLSLIIYISMTIIYKLIFNISYKQSILVCGVSLFLILICDVLCAITISPVVSTEQVQGYSWLKFITNFFICLLAFQASRIPMVRNRLSKFVTRVDNNKLYDKYIFIILMVIVSSILIHSVFIYFHSSPIKFTAIIIIIIIFTILFLIYLKSQNENNKLIEKVNYLYDYSKNYEEWITKEELNIHENKNQLILIRDMAKNNPKVVNYINEILNESFKVENKWISQLSNIPSGGLRGLIYYKLVMVEKNNLNFCVDISKNAKKALYDLQSTQLKDISYIIGIFLDNAIEASVSSKKKLFSLEIYYLNNVLNIVISNSYDGNVDPKKINIKGYSTKGKNHGKGLYFVQKIQEKNHNIDTSSKINNNIFIQRIIIK